MKRRTNKSTIAIVGAGSLASTLALALRDTGHAVAGIYVRDRAASATRGRRLAMQVGTRVRTLGTDPINADTLWLCVPDAAIADCALTVARQGDVSLRIALHSSGALSSTVLTPLAVRGIAIGSAHPMMTFVNANQPSLRGVSFGLEGEPRAVRAANALIRSMCGNVLKISTRNKPLYHAWGMFCSPLLIATLSAGGQAAALAGIDARRARSAMAPIIQQTVTNYFRFGAARAFSGPLQRGDVETVRAHVEALRHSRELLAAYSALANIALRQLPVKNSQAIQKSFHMKDAKVAQSSRGK